MARVTFFVVALASVACGSGSNTATPAPTPAPPGPATSAAAPGVPVRRDLFMPVGSFSPARGDSARRAFVPEIAADESGGECSINRTLGSGATMAIAYFPARVKALMQVNITFDSSGRLVRYSERRGIPETSSKGLKLEQLDSLIRAQEAKTRSTSVNLDYGIDQGMVMNRGGGKPINAVIGTVREVERMEKLGPITARLERVRKLCGV